MLEAGMPYTALTELPTDAVGENGRPSLLLAPITETSDYWASSETSGTGQEILNLPVFRTGKFKDSKGRPREFSLADLRAIVTNFDALRANQLFVDVPVRENHSRDVRQIGGYFKALRVGEKPDPKGRYLLYADLDITEPEMYARWDRKTYRSRSIEIGAYESNDGDIYYPCALGVAFCDISAVEGLFAASLSVYTDETRPEVVVFATETTSTSTPGTVGTQIAPDELDLVVTTLRQAAQKAVEHPDTAVAIHKVIQAVEAIRNGTVPVVSSTPKTAQTAATGAEKMTTMKFTAPDGREVEAEVDDAASNLISAFAAALTETRTENASLKETITKSALAAREAAVDAWVVAKKITPAEVEATKTFVRLLTDDQFTAHETMITARPELTFATGVETGSDDDADKTAVDSAREQYRMLKAAGVTTEKLVASRAAKVLAAHNALPEE